LSFTTAIYKLSIIKENNISFLEDISCFEDPYFVMTLMPHINNIELINDVKYYYLSNPESKTSKSLSVQTVKDVSFSCLEVLRYLNKLNIEKKHYCIVFSHLYKAMEQYANNFKLSKEINVVASHNIALLVEESKYLKDCLEFYYLDKKENAQKAWMDSIRKNLKKV
jgi:tRNA-dihydrouridine synthase